MERRPGNEKGGRANNQPSPKYSSWISPLHGGGGDHGGDDDDRDGGAESSEGQIRAPCHNHAIPYVGLVSLPIELAVPGLESSAFPDDF